MTRTPAEQRVIDRYLSDLDLGIPHLARYLIAACDGNVLLERDVGPMGDHRVVLTCDSAKHASNIVEAIVDLSRAVKAERNSNREYETDDD